MKRLAIFASGTGSNAEKIIEYFDGNPDVKVDLIVTNRRKAGVIEKANTHEIPFMIIGRESFYHTDQVVRILQDRAIDLIILAGFLWLIPKNLIASFPIINIHPALLPKYGGKGMYGHHVHEAVHRNGELESGITIHWVNEVYDQGEIIFQAQCPLTRADNPETIAKKVQLLEHQHYPAVIERCLERIS